MFAGHPVSHFLLQVVGRRVGRIERPDVAEAAEAGRRFGRRHGIGRVDRPPVCDLQHRRREQARDGDPGAPDVSGPEHGDNEMKPHRAGGQAKRDVEPWHQGVVPSGDRLERRIDHARAVDRDRRQHRRQPRGQQPDAGHLSQPDPAPGEARDGDIGEDRGDALAGQPGRAELGHGPPGALGVTQVKRRRQQPGRDQRDADENDDRTQFAHRRKPARADEDRRDRQQPVAEAGRGGKEDDGIGGVHGQAAEASESSLSTQPRNPPSGLASSRGSVAPAPAVLSRTGKYLLVGAHSISGIRS